MAIGNFERFTERARRVLTLAQEEAQRFNHNYLGTEHILLGLVAEKDGVAARVLQNFGVQLPQVRSSVEYIIGRGESPGTGEIGLTPRAKKVIQLAIRESKKLKHNYVGTEHLLLGLVREGEGVAAGVLVSLGVTMPGVRAEIMTVIRQYPGGRRPFAAIRDTLVPEALMRAFPSGRRRGADASGQAAPKDNVVTFRVDDRDLAAIDALVEAGIRSTRSDAAAWLIHAGIEANRELFDKVYATVEEIRKLRLQAQAIVEQHVAGRPEPPGQPGGPPPDQDAPGEQAEQPPQPGA